MQQKLLKMKPDQRRAYNAIIKHGSDYGVFRKVCAHVHTPASHDYRLLQSWKEEEYLEKSEEDIFEICIENKIFPATYSISEIRETDYDNCYRDKKELLSYLLLANAILNEGIEVVIVSDHNTIDGCDKLEVAIKYEERRNKRKKATVIYGIEISCADRAHVVGIFGRNKVVAVKEWLNKNLFNHKDGSYKTSLDVIDFFDTIGGMAYIAHINSSSILDKENLNHAYKSQLFKYKALKVVGLSDIRQQERISERLWQGYKVKKNYILDCDAHSLEEIKRNHFWIKCNEVSFATIMEAMNDYDVSVSLSEPTNNHIHIRGLYIENLDEGFLHGNESEGGFCLTFSDALNCIIGGRGTGKSTVLDILEYSLSQRCKKEETLDFLCRHGNVWVLIENDGKEYLIEQEMPVKDSPSDHILRCFGSNPKDYHNYRYRYCESEVQEFSIKHYLSVFQIIEQEDEVLLKRVKEKREILGELYARSYSINNMVYVASSDDLNDFIYRIMFNDISLGDPEDKIKCNKIDKLLQMLDKVQTVAEKRAGKVNDIICSFNDEQKGKLRIRYYRDSTFDEPALVDWIFYDEEWFHSKNSFFELSGKRYAIYCLDVADFFSDLFMELGLYDFLKAARNPETIIQEWLGEFKHYRMDRGNREIESGIDEINDDTAKDIIRYCCSKIYSQDNLYRLMGYIKRLYKGADRFTLEFNIDNKAGGAGQHFRDIRTLSLGQKVVAMLSFVLGYSKYANDYRPLLLDQPEDNLDNQYIYNTLVSTLRDTKNERQVIIATHNATIVTNAMADQVCVMNSDNNHGWIESTGYPSEKRIKKHIINYLEGGIDSFSHKIDIYYPVLGKKGSD